MTDSGRPRPKRAFTKRSTRWRKAGLGIVLAPLLLLSAGQTTLTCEKTGDTSLQILEVELLGVNQITFDTALRAYSVWPTPAATTFRLRALSTDPAAVVTYNMLSSGAQLGIGGGVAVLDTPPQQTPLFVWVKAPGGKSGSYKVTFDPVCPQGDVCDYGGVPGVCFSGVCETDPPTDGTLLVNGELNLCAELSLPSVSATYAERGATIDVSVLATDPDTDPIDYLWTATGGSFDDPNAASATYTCDEPGPQVIALGISDDGFDQCIEEWATIVVCGDTYLCAGVDCDDGDICTDDSCDPATGLCDHVPAIPPEPVEATCDDGLDNDCDGLVDSADDDCAPAVICPCFTVEELVYNRPYDECWDWHAVYTYGPGLYVYRHDTLIDGRTGEVRTLTHPSAGIGCNFAACAQDPPGAELHGSVTPGDTFVCNRTRAAYEGNGVITLEQWNACQALLEAEVANAGLDCFECIDWQQCDQSGGSNQCINNRCQY